MSRWSARLRIAVASGLLVAALLGLVALVIAVQGRASASVTAARLASDDLAPYATDLRTQPDEEPDVPSPGVLVRIADPAGRIVRDTMPADLAPPRYAVVQRSVRTPQGVWRLTAARDVAVAGAAADSGALTLAAATPLVAAATGLGACVVAGFALRPVERMRRSAERLRATGSAGALPVGPADDELARLARTLNDLLAGLRAGVEHERRLTADASHELRTPIAVLAAQAELAGSPPTERDIAEIRRSAQRLVRIADDLLELSRPSAAARPVPVGLLVTEAMDAVDRARLLAHPGVLVDLELAPLDERAACPMDPVAFGRVLANLLANAVAQTERGEVAVRLGAEGGELVLEVADTGSGVPEAFLPRAFDRFSRPEGAGERAGAGLGLAVVDRLVTAAGGTVALANRPNGGAVATVRLPLGPDGGAAPERAPKIRDLEPVAVAGEAASG